MVQNQFSVSMCLTIAI